MVVLLLGMRTASGQIQLAFMLLVFFLLFFSLVFLSLNIVNVFPSALNNEYDDDYDGDDYGGDLDYLNGELKYSFINVKKLFNRWKQPYLMQQPSVSKGRGVHF